MAMRYYAPFPGGSGDPARPRVPHALRIGDAERDAAATELGDHYAAGRLTLDELHERLDAAFAAKTLGQLTRVMADLPGPGRLHWPAGPGLMASPGGRPAPALTDWRGPPAPAGFHYHGPLGPADGPWHLDGPAPDGYRPSDSQEPTPTDRAGRYAALSLLMLAMLIWLFTALLFARHGVYHPGGPMMPPDGHPFHDFGQSGPP
jgi:hypothetical protein